MAITCGAISMSPHQHKWRIVCEIKRSPEGNLSEIHYIVPIFLMSFISDDNEIVLRLMSHLRGCLRIENSERALACDRVYGAYMPHTRGRGMIFAICSSEVTIYNAREVNSNYRKYNVLYSCFMAALHRKLS